MGRGRENIARDTDSPSSLTKMAHFLPLSQMHTHTCTHTHTHTHTVVKKHVQCELKGDVAVVRLNSPGSKVWHDLWFAMLSTSLHHDCVLMGPLPGQCTFRGVLKGVD